MSTPTAPAALAEPSYNVFLSWSGERSRAVAEALHGWLPLVVQSARPWMSSTDIGSGRRWRVELGRQLQSIKIGIACMTPEKKHSHTIHFEAGAITKFLDDDSRLITFCLGLRPAELDWPLSDFQGHVATVESDARRLVSAVHAATGGQLDSNQLDHVFRRFWSDLKAQLDAIREPAEKAPTPAPPRPVEDMFAEILERIRALDRDLPMKVTARDLRIPASFEEVEANLHGQRRVMSPALWNAALNQSSNVPPPLGSSYDPHDPPPVDE